MAAACPEQRSPDTDHMTRPTPAIDSNAIFRSQNWINVLRETYGYQLWNLRSQLTNSPPAFLPVLEVVSKLTGKRGIALPFTDTCEPICHNITQFNDLIRQLTELGKKRSWNYFELRGAQNFFQDTPPSTQFYTHSLELDTDTDRLLKNLSSATRRNLNKAKKSALKIEQSTSLEALESFYKLQCLTRKRHGLPPQPIKFFRNIHQNLLSQDMGFIVTATFENRPIAACLYLHNTHHAVYKYGASDIAYQNLRANNLIMWHAINYYATKGYKSLDLGRSSLHHEGLRRFKLSWGCQENISSYFRFDLNKDHFTTSKDDTAGWHTRIFRALPIPLSRLAGSLLYRHIA